MLAPRSRSRGGRLPVVVLDVAVLDVAVLVRPQPDLGDLRAVIAYVECELAEHLRCGILAHGFARALHHVPPRDRRGVQLQRRGLCPPCTARRMVDTAAHLVDHVLPRAVSPGGVHGPQGAAAPARAGEARTGVRFRKEDEGCCLLSGSIRDQACPGEIRTRSGFSAAPPALEINLGGVFPRRVLLSARRRAAGSARSRDHLV